MSLELDWGALLRHEMVSSKFPMNGVTNLLRNMAKLGIRYIDLSKLPLDARTLIKVSVRVYIYICIYMRGAEILLFIICFVAIFDGISYHSCIQLDYKMSTLFLTYIGIMSIKFPIFSFWCQTVKRNTAPVDIIDKSTRIPRSDGQNEAIDKRKYYAYFGAENVLMKHSPGHYIYRKFFCSYIYCCFVFILLNAFIKH